MALNNLGLGFLLTAKDLASGVIGQVRNGVVQLQVTSQNATNNMSTMFRSMAQGAILAGGGFIGLKASMSLAKTSGEFTREMAFVRKATEANSDEFKQMHQAAFDIGKDMPVTALEAAKSLYTIGQAGFDAAQSLALLRPVETFKVLSHGELDAAKSASIMAAAIRIWGKDAKDATGITDTFAAAVNTTRMDFKDLPLMLAGGARAAAAAGFGFKESILAMGMIRNVIPTAERAATAFGTFAERLNDTKSVALLTAAGVQVLNKKTHEKNNVRDIIGSLVDVTSAMKTANEASVFVQKTFKTRASSGLNALILQLRQGRMDQGVFRKGRELWDYMQAKGSKGGTAAEFLAAATQNYAGSLDKLHTSWENAKVAFGEAFEDVWSPIVRGVTKSIQFLQDAWLALPMPIRRFVAALLTAVSAILFVAGTVKIISVGFALLTMVLGALEITLGGMVLTILPILGIFAMLGAVIYAFVVASNHNLGGLATNFGTFVGKIKLFWEGLTELFEYGGFREALYRQLATPQNAGLMQFILNVWHWIGRMQQAFIGMGDGFNATIDRLGPVFSQLEKAFIKLGEALGLGGHDVAENREQWASWYRVGYFIGEFIGFLSAVIVSVLGYAISYGTGLVYSFKVAFAILGLVAKVVFGIFKVFASIIMWVAEKLGFASDAADHTSDMFTILGIIMGVKMVESSLLLLTSLGQLIIGWITMGVSAVTAGIAAFIAWLPVFLMMLPFILLIAAVVLIFYGIYKLGQYMWEPMTAGLDRLSARFQIVGLTLSNMWSGITDSVEEAADATRKYLKICDDNESARIADRARQRAKAKAGRENEMTDLLKRAYAGLEPQRTVTRDGGRVPMSRPLSPDEAAKAVTDLTAYQKNIKTRPVGREELGDLLSSHVQGAQESTMAAATQSVNRQMTMEELVKGLKAIPGTNTGVLTADDLTNANGKLLTGLNNLIGSLSVNLDGTKVGNLVSDSISKGKGLAFSGAGPKD